MKDNIEKIDILMRIERSLDNLSQTMSVIYEGLYEGGMVEDSPHCILVLQSAVQEIIRIVNEERENLNREEA